MRSLIPIIKSPSVLILIVTFLLSLGMVGTALHQWAAPDAPVGVQDPDVWLRLMLVEMLHNSGDWYHRTLTRISAPEGLTNHWTRPVDVLLLIPAWVGSAFVPFREALWASSIFYNVMLLMLAVAGTLWALAPLRLSAVGMAVAAGCWLLDPMLRMMFLIGRADHHSLLLVVMVWLFGCAARMEQGRARTSLAAGVLSGLGLWIAPEFLLVIALVMGWFGVRWLREGGVEPLRNLRLFSLAALIVVSIAVMLEWRPEMWGTVSHGRVSVVHISLLAIAYAALWAVQIVARNGGLMRRGISGTVVGIGCAVLLHTAFPGVLQGGYADMSPELLAAFNANMNEMKPAMDEANPLAGVLLLLPFIMVLFGARVIMREPFTQLLLLCLMIFWVMTVLQVRWGGYAAVAAAALWGVLAHHAVAWVRARFPALEQSGVRVPSLAVLMAALLLRLALLGGYAFAASASESETAQTCKKALTKMIERDAFAGVVRFPADVVLTHGDLAMQVLYFTPHGSVASNYHTNRAALADLDRFYFARDDEEARAALQHRGVGVVAVCRDAVKAPMVPPYEGAQTPVYLEQLAAGHVPDFLEKVPGDFPPELLFFRTVGIPPLAK